MKLSLAWSVTLLLLAPTAWTQGTEGPYDRSNSFSILSEYSNDSSHIIAGQARQRKLVTLGGAYTRRVARFAGTEIGYRVEIRPLIFESDPVQVLRETITTDQGSSSGSFTQAVAGVCRPFTENAVQTYPEPLGTVTTNTAVSCGRQWTFGQAFTPFGFQYTTAIRHRVQPYVVGALGYIYTSRPIPISDAESLNFVVDVGAGVQVYRSNRRSIALEARVRHISNRNTAQANPGMDTVTYGVAYSFGH